MAISQRQRNHLNELAAKGEALSRSVQGRKTSSNGETFSQVGENPGTVTGKYQTPFVMTNDIKNWAESLYLYKNRVPELKELPTDKIDASSNIDHAITTINDVTAQLRTLVSRYDQLPRWKRFLCTIGLHRLVRYPDA